MGYIQDNEHLKPCPWCGTSIGYYESKYLAGNKIYRYVHMTQRCNLKVETEWCPTKEGCDEQWNDTLEERGDQTPDETDTIHCTSDDGREYVIHVMECPECGHTYEHVNGDYERCPHCGIRFKEPSDES